MAILTTREPYAIEDERFIFAVFLVDDADEGNNQDEGYVKAYSKYRISLTPKEAKKMLFWNYYHNDNSPENARWGQGLHRYISNTQAANILKDIAKVKKGTADEELAQDFFGHFCKINGINPDFLPDPDGALKR